MSSRKEQIWKSLKDQDFRKEIIDEHVNVGIAFQIRSLRNRQQLKQSGLAKLLDVKQPLISSWENPNYGKYSLQTLKDLAKAFDVGLLVRFVPFSQLIDWTVNLTSDVIAPPSFTEEQYHVQAPGSPASNVMTAAASNFMIAGDTNNLVLAGFDKPVAFVGAVTASIEPAIEKEKVYATT